jgi:hypothetical protein
MQGSFWARLHRDGLGGRWWLAGLVSGSTSLFFGLSGLISRPRTADESIAVVAGIVILVTEFLLWRRLR